MWKKIPDSLALGFFSGFISLILFYLLLGTLQHVIPSGGDYLFQPPKVQLFAIFMNILAFRFVIVRGEKEKLGKGILLATVSVSFVYFFYFFRYHHSII